MEQRDLIKDQIEQLGRVLGKIIAGFLGLKDLGKIEQGIEISNEKLKEEIDLDVDIIINCKYQELSDYLENLKLSSEHIEMLIDYVIEIGEYKLEIDRIQGIRIFERVLEMYKIQDSKSNIYSFTRIKKEERIKNLLKKMSK